MERPNTVSGLLQKRRELMARLKVVQAEARTLTMGLDAIDISLRLFGAEDVRTRPMRLPPAHPAKKGEFQRLVLDLFRETGSPITSRMLADRFCETRDLKVDDVTYKAIRYRATSGLCHMRDRGMIRRIGAAKGAHAKWELVEDFDLEMPRY